MDQMKAIQIEMVGGPEVLQIVELPIPMPDEGQVLVKVIAAGINFIDTYYRSGRYQAQLPLVLGQEGSGIVTKLGSGVSDLLVGDRIAWSKSLGTYAEYLSVDAKDVVKLPEEISFEKGAAIMTQGLTAHYLAYSTFQIQPKDRVLIHAGAGGVGLLLTQLAKRCGAHVTTTVSSEEKKSFSLLAGADEVVIYNTESFLDKVMESSSGEGVNVVYDGVGQATFDESLKCLKTRGLMVLFGGSSGPVEPFQLMRLSSEGSLFITRPSLKDYIRSRSEFEWRADTILSQVASGEISLHIGGRYRMDEIKQAHMDLEGRKSIGKLILEMIYNY